MISATLYYLIIMISMIGSKVLQSLKKYVQRVRSHLKFSNSDKQLQYSSLKVSFLKSAGNCWQPRPSGVINMSHVTEAGLDPCLGCKYT